MKKLSLLLPLILLVALVGAGCKRRVQSAHDVARIYLAFMKAEKYEKAAKMWDYVTQARKDNEDWDNIQEGQRKLIADKLASEKEPSLELWSGYFQAATRIAAFNEMPDHAEAQLEGGRVKKLELTKVGEEWKITGMN